MPSSTYETADGHVNIGAAGRKFRRLADALGIPELVDHPDYQTTRGKRANKAAINAAVAEALKKRTTAEWVEILNEAGVPSGPILHIDEALSDPQVKHLDIARPVDHPVLGRIEVVGQPYRLSDRPRSR